MWLHNLRSWFGLSEVSKRSSGRPRSARRLRLCLERLEDRLTPSLPIVTLTAFPSSPIQVGAQGFFTVSRSLSTGSLGVSLHVDSSSTVPAGYHLSGSSVSFNSFTNIVTLSFPNGV